MSASDPLSMLPPTSRQKLNLTSEEVQRFTEAMKDEKFRQLFREYAEEISDPKNKEEYERYLLEMESRGNLGENNLLLHPEPVLCVKFPSTPYKVFINLAVSHHLDAAQEKKGEEQGNKGAHFSLPYSLSHHRDFKDQNGGACKAWDFVFSEATWKKYESNPRVVGMFISMALEAIDTYIFKPTKLHPNVPELKEKLATLKPIILQNVKFKGGKPPVRLFKKENTPNTDNHKNKPQTATTPKANTTTSTKTSTSTSQQTTTNSENKKKSSTSSTNSSSSTAASASTATPAKSLIEVVSSTTNADTDETTSPSASTTSKLAIPSYNITHRGYFELAGYFMKSEEDLNNSLLSPVTDPQYEHALSLQQLLQSRPKELYVRIELPLVQSVSDIQLDLSVQRLKLTVEEKYALDATLPFPVNDQTAVAKYIAKTKTMTLTLTVLKPTEEEINKMMQQRNEIRVKKLERLQANSTTNSSEEDNATRKESTVAAVSPSSSPSSSSPSVTPALAISTTSPTATTTTSLVDVDPDEVVPEAIFAPTSPALHSILKTSPSHRPSTATPASPPLISESSQGEDGANSNEEKHVRFKLPSGRVPERDRPVPAMQKKKTKHKHKPGEDGGALWTGIGEKPPKCFPINYGKAAEQAIQQWNENKKNNNHPSASPSLRAHSPSNSAATLLQFPAYTYSQSPVNVVLVFKVKNITAADVTIHFEEKSCEVLFHVHNGNHNSNSNNSGGNKKNNHQQQHDSLYHIYLPLANSIAVEKCAYDVNSANIVVRLAKVVHEEWTQLCDYSQWETDSCSSSCEPSPCFSPAAHQTILQQQLQEMEPLQLLETHDPSDEQTSSSSSSSSTADNVQAQSMSSATTITPTISTTMTNSLIFELD